MRRFCTALALLLAQPVSAAEMTWFGGGDELNAELRYGTADKSDTPISFYCTPHVKIVYVDYDFKPANATEAMEIDFTLSAGGIDIEVGAIGYGIEMDDGFVLEGQILFDQKFLDFIASDGVITATAEGKTEEFPLAGAKEVSGPLLETCGREAP
ncbi:MAG: hypothetical protein AB7I79_18460 [Rhizobiaceae bacterium]